MKNWIKRWVSFGVEMWEISWNLVEELERKFITFVSEISLEVFDFFFGDFDEFSPRFWLKDPFTTSFINFWLIYVFSKSEISRNFLRNYLWKCNGFPGAKSMIFTPFSFWKFFKRSLYLVWRKMCLTPPPNSNLNLCTISPWAWGI